MILWILDWILMALFVIDSLLIMCVSLHCFQLPVFTPQFNELVGLLSDVHHQPFFSSRNKEYEIRDQVRFYCVVLPS